MIKLIKWASELKTSAGSDPAVEPVSKIKATAPRARALAAPVSCSLNGPIVSPFGKRASMPQSRDEE